MTTEVRTSAGTVRGSWSDGIAAYRGIPFAAPPVGPDRFAVPRPASPWDGVRDATRNGSPPPQPGRTTEGPDWLNLAVWTPAPGRTGLPVVVWISGGGFLNCNAANPHLDGTTLAGTGAVVVSAHYRTGAEGFARIEGAPDNRGLLDQIAALRWVQENIAGFGGDPENVTVLGQSAGANSIAALLVMPAAAGLFRRAILQSLPETYFAPDLAADIAREITAGLGRAPRLADLADVAPDDLVAAARSVTERLPHYADRWGAVAHTPTPFSPVVDGEVLREAPWAALAAGAARDVDLLIGHGRDEFSLLARRLTDVDDTEADALIDALTPTPGSRRYRTAYPLLSPTALRDTAMSDWLFRMPALHLADAAHTGGARVWFYELCWGFNSLGASHSLDTLLVFGTAEIGTGLADAGPDLVTQSRRLSELMRTEHVAFAATGDPGWTRYDPRERATRLYDAESTIGRYLEEESRRIWRDQRFGVLERTG
ncbi:carboxylesterase/lipase family protein [Pseudonocardia sp. MH-G8]|uniref:carboxylesterase/lipase family protein n=1 Tax=Pseudonocardia sp. MH-G8 TaxID=1854588 RepID=UPI000BA07ACA|nr:carboxylesterase family protein [Pseudonocardia sp. MH-G8]OZM79445.1 carboxylesterase [Pseudonocardia sp. MH-G8]